MIFMFWTGTMLPEPPAAPAWRERFPNDFIVYGDADVLPLLKSETHRECFKRIRIPACKSHVARLLLLREYGGVYIDGHTGPGGGDAIAMSLLHLEKYELVLFKEGWRDEFAFFGNTFMVARRGANILDVLIEKAFSNLFKHQAAEDLVSGYIPYNILNLTGTRVIIDCLFDVTDINAWKTTWEVRSELRDKVYICVKETSVSDIGFAPWMFYHYRSWGQHWSERQQSERLFEEKELSPASGEGGLRRKHLLTIAGFPSEAETRSLTPLAIRHGVTLGAIAKNEGRYLPEWIAYHLAIGFDRIVVYSNDTEDNQNELLEAISKRDPRVYWLRWPSIPGISAQNSAYNDLLGRCVTPWVAFLDIDEFVVPLEDAGIHEWLATVPEDVSTVHINWRGFGSNWVSSPDYELVTRTFDMAAPTRWSNHRHFKSFGRVPFVEDVNVHNIIAKSGRRTLSDFGEFETISNGYSDRIVYHRIQINHYQCKTYSEFQARMRRGSVAVSVDHQLRQRDARLERFQELDLNVELNRSIRRFDVAFDASLKYINDIIAELAPNAAV
jgi:hypothetical protein